MSLLLDTHVWLWFESELARLDRKVRAAIVDPERDVFVSAASFWEIATKQRLGKIVYGGSARAALNEAGFVELAIDGGDAELAGRLDWAHRDPFDRMMVAQCLNRALTLVTADAALQARRDIAILPAG